MQTWSEIGPVDVSALAAWLDAGNIEWPPVKGTQPNRIRLPDAARSAVDDVLAYYPGMTFNTHQACISRIVPGAVHEMHSDGQADNWVTRVHVPIKTNESAWFMFEHDMQKVHFRAGVAYSFNTWAAHCYGNEGTEDRVHLMLDICRLQPH